jgi:hypothetical protein
MIFTPNCETCKWFEPNITWIIIVGYCDCPKGDKTIVYREDDICSQYQKGD